MRKSLVAIAIAATVAIGGCSAATPTTGTPVPSSTSVHDGALSEAVKSIADAATSAAQDALAGQDTDIADSTDNLTPPPPDAQGPDIKFGGVWKWEDGMSAQVGAPQKYRASNTAAGGVDYKYQVSFKITIHNGGTQRFTPMASMTVNSGGAEAEQIFDSEKNIGASPTGSLRPGKSVSFFFAYGVNDPKDLDAQLSIDWNHDPAFFIN